jgi:hypothetical protein
MRYYPVDMRFWSDPRVRGWSDDAKLLALYLLTCPHRTTEGLFRLPKLYVQADLGWSAERLAEPFRELLAEPFPQPGFMDHDEAAQVVLIRNAMKYQPPQNDNQVKAALSRLEELPPTPLTSTFKALAERFCQRLAKRLPEGFGEGYGHPLTLTPTLTPTREDPPVEQARPSAADIESVFETWKQSTGKHKAQLDSRRRRKIIEALKGFPLEDVLAAVQGWENSPHHRGENERHTVYNDLELLLRDVKHIEMFRGFHHGDGLVTAARSVPGTAASAEEFTGYETTGRIAL